MRARIAFLLLAVVLTVAAPSVGAFDVTGPPVLAEGDYWETRHAQGAGNISTDSSAHSAVDGFESLDVGGEPIETVRIVTRSTSVMELRANDGRVFEYVTEARTTSWSRVADGADVRSVTDATRTGPDGTGKITRTEITYDPPCARFQWPLEVGKQWSVDCTARVDREGEDAAETKRERDSFRVVREELVTTDLGTFRVLVIENATTGSDAGARRWYAPKACGDVRTESWSGASANTTFELVDYRCSGETMPTPDLPPPQAPPTPDAEGDVGVNGDPPAETPPAPVALAVVAAAAVALLRRRAFG